MSRVYVEIDGVKVKVVKIGRGMFGRWVDVELTTPDSSTRRFRLHEGETVKAKIAHEYTSGGAE